MHREFEIAVASHGGVSFATSIQTIEAQPVIALEHRGSYMGIGRAFDLLHARAAAAGLLRPNLRMLALFHDDPDAVPEPQLCSHAALAGCAHPVTEDSGLLQMTIAGGRHAVLEHHGPYASMRAAYRWLFGEWLARSVVEPGDGPVVEEYLNSPRTTRPDDLRTRIALPVRVASEVGTAA